MVTANMPLIGVILCICFFVATGYLLIKAFNLMDERNLYRDMINIYQEKSAVYNQMMQEYEEEVAMLKDKLAVYENKSINVYKEALDEYINNGRGEL